MTSNSDIKIYKPNIIPQLIRNLVFFAIFALILYFEFSRTSIGLHNTSYGGFNSVLFFVYLSLWIIISFISVIQLIVSSYELHDDNITIKTGIIGKSHKSLMFSEIQDVKSSQDWISRIFGVTNLNINTMSYGIGIVQFISMNSADEIRNFILSKTTNKKVTQLASQNKYANTNENANPYQIHPMKKLVTASLMILFLIIITIIVVLSFTKSIQFNLNSAFWLVMGGFLGVIIFFKYLGYLVHIIIFALGFKYYVTNDYIEQDLNFISRSSSRITYDKIQDTIIKIGPIDRIIGLSSLRIESGEKVVYENKNEANRMAYLNNGIPYLKEDSSSKLQDKILKLMGIKNANVDSIRQKYPIDNIKPVKKSLSFGFRFTITVTIIILFVYFFTLIAGAENFNLMKYISIPLILGIIILVVILKYIYEIFYFKSYYYADNNEILILRKGVIGTRALTIPYNKTQHLFVDQDLFDKIFGLYDVHIASASGVGMSIHIDGLKKEYANAFKDYLRSKIIEK